MIQSKRLNKKPLSFAMKSRTITKKTSLLRKNSRWLIIIYIFSFKNIIWKIKNKILFNKIYFLNFLKNKKKFVLLKINKFIFIVYLN